MPIFGYAWRSRFWLQKNTRLREFASLDDARGIIIFSAFCILGIIPRAAFRTFPLIISSARMVRLARTAHSRINNSVIMNICGTIISNFRSKLETDFPECARGARPFPTPEYANDYADIGCRTLLPIAIRHACSALYDGFRVVALVISCWRNTQ